MGETALFFFTLYACIAIIGFVVCIGVGLTFANDYRSTGDETDRKVAILVLSWSLLWLVFPVVIPGYGILWAFQGIQALVVGVKK